MNAKPFLFPLSSVTVCYFQIDHMNARLLIFLIHEFINKVINPFGTKFYQALDELGAINSEPENHFCYFKLHCLLECDQGQHNPKMPS